MTNYKYLRWDSQFFGFKIAKIYTDVFKINELNRILQELKAKNYKLAYLSSNPQDTLINNEYIKNGGKLVDVKTTFSVNLSNINIREYNSYIFFYKSNNIAKELIDIAIQTAEYSRFKTDSFFPAETYKKLYSEWIIKSVNKKLADDVLVYKLNDKIDGLITLGTENKNNKIGFIGLVGVDSQERGKGIGIILLDAAKHYFINKGFKILNVVTQGNNLPACKLYLRSGFYISKVENYYHFWL